MRTSTPAMNDTRSESVVLHEGAAPLAGEWALPAKARGAVIFAHGSGSSRFSPRNHYVAAGLQRAGYATLLCDLLTPDEDVSSEARFDIRLLTRRLIAVANEIEPRAHARGLPLGFFGASTGAAAALSAAAALGPRIAAVVSRGGRPDLARKDLGRVLAPTLLIVGERDREVLRLNRMAAEAFVTSWEIAIVPGASHLFEEPGALDEVVALAADWFERHLLASATHAHVAARPEP